MDEVALLETIESLTKTLNTLKNKSKVIRTVSPPVKEFVSKQKAAEILGCSVRTVERYLENGLLQKHIRGANRVVVLKTEVLALVR
jgi:hypothetical protein